jgi:hypothetical protein
MILHYNDAQRWKGTAKTAAGVEVGPIIRAKKAVGMVHLWKVQKE